jgi:tetratricopeptide (TPR) repeat protein
LNDSHIRERNSEFRANWRFSIDAWVAVSVKPSTLMTQGKTAAIIGCLVGLLGVYSLQGQGRPISTNDFIPLTNIVVLFTNVVKTNVVITNGVSTNVVRRTNQTTRVVTAVKTNTAAIAAARAALLDQGRSYGAMGEWKKGLDCFKQASETGNLSESDWPSASVIALAAGETNICEQFCMQYMKAYGKASNANVAERIAKECFSLPNCSEELLNQAMDRADFAMGKGQTEGRSLVKGMGEYRKRNWSGAVQNLGSAEGSGALELGAVAWAFDAMARQQLGETNRALRALEQVNRRLGAIMRTGELGSWQEVARAYAIRDEAEFLILGKITSSPFTTAELRENRKKWQEVTFSLNAANTMASQFQWVPAAEYFGKVLQDTAFDWNTSELKQDNLAQQMGIVFLLAGEQGLYGDLVRGLLERKLENLPASLQRRNAFIFMCNAGCLPEELKAQALAYGRRMCDTPDTDIDPWLRLLRGQIEYREGQFEKCVETLSQAFFRSEEADGASQTMFYKAKALARLGKSKEALEATQEGIAIFTKQSTKDTQWLNRAQYQLEMKELLGLLASANEQAKDK